MHTKLFDFKEQASRVAHYNFFQHITPDSNLQKLIAAGLVGSALVLLGKKLTSRLATPNQIESAIVPDEKISLFGVFDFIIEGFVAFHDSILGKENRRFVPFCFTVFLFILISNLLGLVPGFPAITTSVWINVAIAIVSFTFFNYQGLKAHGFLMYMRHFFGPLNLKSPAILLALLIFVIEIFSTLLRILTLNLRLYWNITGDHLVLEAFTEMWPHIGVPVVFYLLGTFVCFMQAFVFTILTMIYTLLATQHSEDH